MNYEQLLQEVEKFIKRYFKTHHDDRYIYHNAAHTRDVVKAVTLLADHYQLNDEDRFTVITAAWFHDTGYLGADATNHEERSALIATDYLKGLSLASGVTRKVQDCILATRMPQHPETLLENILCDADLFHLGQDDFAPKSRLMRKEMETLKYKRIKKSDWRRMTIQLMENHQYHTEYAQLLLNTTKERNLEKLRSKQKEATVTVTPAMPNLLPQPEGVDDKTWKKICTEKPTKGVETMFRVTASNHQRLSDMADSKANIMISVNAILISLLLSLVLRRLDAHPQEGIPAICLLIVSVITMIFAILATRPNLPPGVFTREDVDYRRVNLLFFGNFYKMSLDDYSRGMVSMMNDRDFLYGSLIRDLYYQGVVLGKKYHLLRTCYNVFMFGLVGSVLAFILSAIIYA